jgi:hypothetical protein
MTPDTTNNSETLRQIAVKATAVKVRLVPAKALVAEEVSDVVVDTAVTL